jgi:hypothetical protein
VGWVSLSRRRISESGRPWWRESWRGSAGRAPRLSREVLDVRIEAASRGVAYRGCPCRVGHDGGERARGPGKPRSRASRACRCSLLDTSLAPSVPSDPALLDAAAGGVPWVLRFGEVSLRDNGRLDVSIRGLVIPTAPFTGTAGPVTTVEASLYCAGNSTPVATSAPVPISTTGDARIRARLTLPATCQIPALLIHPSGAAGVYIASSEFGGWQAELARAADGRDVALITAALAARVARASRFSHSPARLGPRHLRGTPVPFTRWAVL